MNLESIFESARATWEDPPPWESLPPPLSEADLALARWFLREGLKAGGLDEPEQKSL